MRNIPVQDWKLIKHAPKQKSNARHTDTQIKVVAVFKLQILLIPSHVNSWPEMFIENVFWLVQSLLFGLLFCSKWRIRSM